jgi:hypothetical protein
MKIKIRKKNYYRVKLKIKNNFNKRKKNKSMRFKLVKIIYHKFGLNDEIDKKKNRNQKNKNQIEKKNMTN